MRLEADAEAAQRYTRARTHLPDGVPVTLLCVGDSETFVVSGGAGELPSVIRMQMGSGAAGHLALRHEPPTAYELENAIAVVEEGVMPLSRRLPRPSTLLGSGDALGVVVRTGGKGPGKVRLALADVELMFQQLAAVAEGRPAASSGLPTGMAFAATLLILREFMHHLGFDSIAIDAADAP